MRLIDADALIENHFSDGHRIAMSYADKAWMRSIIRNEPTIDAVPVVRCGECMYSASIVDAITHERNGLWCALLDLENVEKDFYCKDGKRREDGDA